MIRNACGKLDQHGFCSPSCNIRTAIKDFEGTIQYYTCYYKLKELSDDPISAAINQYNSPAAKRARAFVDSCVKKFQQENPCPKCGSHDVTIDPGTPIHCCACGNEWEHP